MRARWLIGWMLLIFAAPGFSPPIFCQESGVIIRAEVALVNIIFSATDKKGRTIEGLRAEDFQVFENKQPQKIEYFSDPRKSTEVPLTIALVIDTSGSVKDKLDYEIATAAEFFKQILRPEKDLALIIQFDSDVNLVQDFTQNPQDLLKALETLRAGNSTALYDAVYLAAEEKLKNETGRKVMVVISDGADTASKVRKEEAIEAAQKRDVLIYGIGVLNDPRDAQFDVLKKLARETGGAFFSPKSSLSDIREAFDAIRTDIQGQYSLAYTPVNKEKDGTYRSIEIRCKVPGVRVRARMGYYASKSSLSR